MADRLSVVIVEDHALVREALVQSLANSAVIEITGAGDTLEAGRRLMGELRPEVVVTDYHLPDGVGTALAEHARVAGLPCRVLLFTGRDRRSIVEEAVAAGCDGFVNKSQNLAELVDAIEAVAHGASVFPDGFLRQLARGDRTQVGATLTDRERQTLTLLAQARGAEQISSDLGLSIHTVRSHIRSILVKLHARSQLEAVVTAARAELVDFPG